MVDMMEIARKLGAMPEVIEVGQVFERVPFLCRDGRRMDLRKYTARDHTRIRITAVPGGRRRAYRYVKVDPQRGGNGRPDRGEHTLAGDSLSGFARNYALVREGAA